MEKRVLIVLVSLLLSMAGFSQSRLSFNVNAGLDKNFNKYYTANSYSKIDDPETDFNAGVNVAYRVGEWVRLRLDLQYLQYSYGQEPNSSSEITKTVFRAFNMGIAPRIDFRVYAKHNFELFLSPGLSLQYLIDNDQVSTLTDGTHSYRNYISTDYDNSLTGFVGGALLKYNINERMGLTVSPDYTMFFDQLYDSNYGNLSRFNLSFGFEWNL